MWSNHDEIWNHIGLVETVARSLGIDADLVAGVGFDALQHAADTYDTGRGEFSSYARVCIQREMLRWMRRESKKESLDTFGQTTEDPKSIVEEQTYSEEDMLDLRSRVTDEEYQLLVARFVDGKSLDEIGIEFGVIRQTIWARLQKILDRLR